MNEYRAILEDDEIIRDVRERRAYLMEKYGGWEGYLKHQDEDRPRLIAEGWKFVTPEEVAKRNT